MGKLMDGLLKQLEDPNQSRNARDCITIYNWIKSTDKDGRVWSSRWQPLVNVKWKGVYPRSVAIYSLNITGENLLKGIDRRPR
tara:strand:- start:164 stop:412 length:249 start_codon:yes stop_codon:yes gene_type:complete